MRKPTQFTLKNIKPKEFATFLYVINACEEAQNFARGKSLKQVWKTCKRGDWMEWLINRMTVTYFFRPTDKGTVRAWGGEPRYNYVYQKADAVYDVNPDYYDALKDSSNVWREFYTVGD
jgi:hypothetical protein